MDVDDSLQPVIVCADDYGLAPGVSEVIASLIAAGRLSATSCMSACAAWRSHAGLLRETVTRHPADVGLHLTLTGQHSLLPLSRLAPHGRLPPPGRLLALALARRLHADEIRGEVRAQLDAFEDVWGAPPDYVDGHQHVHLFPGVRECLVAELLRRYGAGRVYLRNCVEPLEHCLARRVAWFKAAFIGQLGQGLAQLAGRHGLALNHGFSGFYDFSPRHSYRRLMQGFLAHRGPLHMVHVHPGKVDADLVALDELTVQRELEFAYLAGDAFAEDLHAAGVRPARFADCRGGVRQGLSGGR